MNKINPNESHRYVAINPECGCKTFCSLLPTNKEERKELSKDIAAQIIRGNTVKYLTFNQTIKLKWGCVKCNRERV